MKISLVIKNLNIKFKPRSKPVSQAAVKPRLNWQSVDRSVRNL